LGTASGCGEFPELRHSFFWTWTITSPKLMLAKSSRHSASGYRQLWRKGDYTCKAYSLLCHDDSKLRGISKTGLKIAPVSALGQSL